MAALILAVVLFVAGGLCLPIDKVAAAVLITGSTLLAGLAEVSTRLKAIEKKLGGAGGQQSKG